MFERLAKGDRISLAGAAVLFIGLFLPWYGIETDVLGGGETEEIVRSLVGDVTANAFEAFEFLDVVLVVLVLAAAALIVLAALGKIDASLHRFVETIGGFALVAVLFRMVFQPDAAALRWGIFVALVGALALVGGQFLTRTGRI